jgi:predicted RND superfamily exporter protein
MHTRINILSPVILILFLFTAGFISPKLVFDDSLQSWVPPESAIIEDYQAFLEEFKTDAIIIVALNDPVYLDSIALGLSQLDHIEKVGPWPPPFLKYKTKPPDRVKALYVSYLPPSHLNPNRPELIAGMEELMDSYGVEYHIAGTGVIHKAINDFTSRASKRYLVMAIMLLCVFLVLFTCDLRTVLKTFGISLGSVAWVMIAAYLLDIRFNTIMSLLPCLILFYSTSVSVHILNHHGEIKKVIWPTLIAVITTCAGFSAFLLDPAPLLQDFGLLAIIGLVGSLFWSLLLFDFQKGHFTARIRFRKQLGFIKSLWNSKTVLTGVVIAAIMLPGSFRIQSEIDIMSVLPNDHPAVQDYIFIEKNFGPYVPVEYEVDLLQTPQDDLREWIDAVYDLDKVGAVMSFLSFPPFLDSRGLGYVSDDGKTGRVVFYVPVISTTEGLELVRKIDELSKKYFPGSQIHPTPTGYVSLYVSVADHLSKSFRQSLLLAFLFVFLVIFLFLRNFKLFLASVLPNLFPVFVILGVMGWLHIPLDMVTVPMGCLALGIIVDDTVHFLYWYRKAGSVYYALDNAGPGTITTSLIYILGFSVFLFSEANPVRFFGILTITAMATALFGDIVLLPHILKRIS